MSITITGIKNNYNKMSFDFETKYIDCNIALFKISTCVYVSYIVEKYTCV